VADTVLITGSTDGLGRELARELGDRGWDVLIHGRDPEKVERVRSELGAAGGYVADLASLDEVRRLAAEVARDHARLKALVNNAGLGRMERRESHDGHELVFAVNYLSHFLLTALLLPLLRRAAPSRIVNVASIGQAPIDFEDVMLERGHEPMRAYAQSKLAQILFTISLADRLEGTGVTVNALHPATLMDTNMVRRSFGRAMSSVEEGVEAALRLVLDPELDDVSGRYFDGLRESRAHEQAYDADAREQLWELSERLSGARYDTG
jgi:NAD(P)-dependent dehydrogenase (short-subunit alcohol dehydrogenase family)